MENIIENTSDSIWAVDKSYCIIYLNDTFKTDFYNVFGVELKSGVNILKVLPEGISEVWKRRYDRALGGKSYSFEQSFDVDEQNTIYVHVSMSPIMTDNLVTGVTCFGRDITRNKLNEIKLHKYSILLQSSIESQKDTILLSIDKDFKYMYFNFAHRQVMKHAYNMDIRIGDNILDCIKDEEDRKAAQRNYEMAMNGESHSNIRAYGQKDKEYYESFFNPIIDDNGEIIGATALARNITLRIKQEEALKKSEESLKLAIATKDKFLSLISHDLRSPIWSITSLANLVCERFEEYSKLELKSFLKNISTGLDRALHLLEDLLLWSRVQRNSIEFNPSVINLSETIHDTIKILEQNIKSKELEIVIHFTKYQEIFADKYMISTVIRNLLSNAIKFSYRKGSIEVGVEERKDGLKNEIHISVKDYGVGISKENIDKVFYIGEYTSTYGTDKEKGNGLGLIMCKEFVDKHQGTITIESEVNKGTRVYVVIPQ
ncbi:sensor histidine kinase [Plebeiibacterium marinum]|uniref:histidine kinase n=1 Tax=Plebeiibacterium marinum TaxID=2992111 RepID=A0AAE3MC66_9BACT|nr:ATP-binding protein [Plebeiobacterium marinum]MCW3804854.1 ATP-binding protein [Plebeiobacterium marinum]